MDVVYVLFSIVWLTASSDAAISREIPKWDGLKVRFGIFKSLPRTTKDATDEGFTKVSDCEENALFRGNQYMKNDDPQVILLFDINGYIAGMQVGVTTGLEDYPPHNIQPPFLKDDNLYKLTAYFVEPGTICNEGRSANHFEKYGTGEVLYIQNGTDPVKDLFNIVEDESKTSWVKGKCFNQMGFHYFHNTHLHMDCDDFLPVASLYYNGFLQGFVWSFGAVLNGTVVPYEKPEPEFFDELMDEVPLCVRTLRRSTLHVYFTSQPETLICENDTMKTTTTTAGDIVAPIGASNFLSCNILHAVLCLFSIYLCFACQWRY